MATTATYTPRLKDKYRSEVVPALMKRFGYTSVMRVPRLEKIALNRGVNGAVNDKKLIDIAIEELTTISGQKAVATMSKKGYLQLQTAQEHADRCTCDTEGR